MILSSNPIIGLSGRWDRSYVTPLARPLVETEESSALIFRINCIRISRVHRGVVPVPYQETDPVPIGDSGRMQRPAWTSPCSGVLFPAVDPIRVLHVEPDLIELPHWQSVVVLPGAAAVVRNVEAPVGSGHHVIGVVGIDPDGVVVEVDALEPLRTIGQIGIASCRERA